MTTPQDHGKSPGMDQPPSDGFQYNAEANAEFHSKEYLKRFMDPKADPMKVHVKFLGAYHNFYDKHVNGKKPLKCLLEFGGGPALHSLISASRYVENISFADYAESNRNEIIMWKDEASGAHDWSNYFQYVLTELEGNTAEGALETRQRDLRGKIKEVVSCNIRSDEFLSSEAQFTSFDVIHTNLCLEIASESKAEFNRCIRTLGTLLKPGGFLVCLTAKGGAWYTCAGAGDKFFQLNMTGEDILGAITESGLSLVEACDIEPMENPLSATKAFQFTIAQKK